MEAMREVWTDERMDDLNHRVDEGFGRMDREFQAIRLEMRTEFAAVRGEMKVESAAIRSELGTTRSELSGQIAALNRTILQVGAGVVATMFIGLLNLVATLAT
jgi:hypothetical protein